MKTPLLSRWSLRLSSLVMLASLLAMKAPLDDSRTFNVKGFDKLDLGNAFTITVRQGSDYHVNVSGRSEDINDLEADVTRGTLKIRYHSSGMFKNQNHKRVNVEIVMPSLNGIQFSGATTSTVTGFRDQKDLDLSISGASTSTIDIDARHLTLDFSGASQINLRGQADSMEGDVSGATTLRAYDLTVKNAKLSVSGASNARVRATGDLDVSASGASSISYRGTTSVHSNTSGASSIHKEG